MGITEILTIIFVFLKCLGKIDWSWWLVFLPEIIAVAVYVGIFVVNMGFLHRSTKIVDKQMNNFWKEFNDNDFIPR